MLKKLDVFRKILDDIMIQAIHKRIVLYGYGYTGRFLKWYAEYYHSIIVDYIITLDTRFGRAYDEEFFQTTLFRMDYKDVSDAVVWIAEPMNDDISKLMDDYGYIKDKTYFDFYEAIYGQDVFWGEQDTDIFKRRKSGKRDIQFLEWLEWKYGCNFLLPIGMENFEVAGEHGASYRTSTQKELFPVLDRCHCIPTPNDAFFDFGCGKGSAIMSALDYGFTRVGGVEYEPKIYEILADNIKKLDFDKDKVECIQGNAAELAEELDEYNWFYFYQPFDDVILYQCINAICESMNRRKRKVHIINICPYYHKYIEETGYFRLVNQFTIDTRQRVVSVFESYV